jgi:threonine dehydrogenase-like Zn-dependent dehydrogenase
MEPGDTVAVFGAGPVRLMVAYSATLRGASRVYSVDYVPERLRHRAICSCQTGSLEPHSLFGMYKARLQHLLNHQGL